MTNTLITNRVVVTDHSVWDHTIRPVELIDGGVTDVILKAGGGMNVDPRFRVNGEAVAKHSMFLRLHAYWWDDPIVGANAQVDFATETVRKSGLPVLSLWGDQEQWWGDWSKWLAARRGKLAWKEVPVLKAWSLDAHYRSFAEALTRLWPQCGLYGGRGFITTYAPGMSKWLGKYKFWIAAYGKQPKTAITMTWQQLRDQWMPDYDPDLRYTGIQRENLVGHQFTGDKCLLPGAYQNAWSRRRKAVDVNVFRRDFMEKTGIGLPGPKPEPVPEPVPGPAGQEYIFLGAHLWVRATPGENSRLVDSLTKSQRVIVLEEECGWARIEKPAGWCRSSWLTRL